MLNCQSFEQDTDSQCGRPVWTNGASYCEKHYAVAFPVTYNRLKSKPNANSTDEMFKQFQEDNKTHQIPQMLFAFKQMWTMRKALGGESRLEYWFKYNYDQNPRCEEALEIIRKMKWDSETGIKGPFEEAIKAITE